MKFNNLYIDICIDSLVSTMEEVNAEENNIVIDHSKVNACNAKKTLEEFENKVSENKKQTICNEENIIEENELFFSI